jgi:hypothetical protein
MFQVPVLRRVTDLDPFDGMALNVDGDVFEIIRASLVRLRLVERFLWGTTWEVEKAISTVVAKPE